MQGYEVVQLRDRTDSQWLLETAIARLRSISLQVANVDVGRLLVDAVDLYAISKLHENFSVPPLSKWRSVVQ